MPGPILVLVSAVVVAAAVAGAWYALGRRPSATDIVDVLALDGEYAVMIRDVARDPGRSFLSLMSAERGEVWGAMIPGDDSRLGAHDDPSAGPGTRLAATAGVITVRGNTGGVPYIHAFAAARGAKLGRYALAAEQPVPAVLPATALPAAATQRAGSIAGDGQSFEVVADARGAIDLVAIDLEQGAPLWRRALGAGPVGPVWLRERHLLVHAAGRLHVLDRRTGEPAHGHANGHALSWPCAVSDRVYGVDGGQVHALSLTGGEVRATGIVATRLTGIGTMRLAGLCGTRGDLDVLAVVEDGAAALVAVDAHTLATRWRLALEQPLLVSQALYLGAPDALSGPLPRFVPMIVGQAEQPGLVSIDVDAGRIARAGTPTPLVRDARVLLASERFYLWTPAGPTLAVLDGATGALTAAVELPGMAPLWPRHVAGGRVWVTRLAHDGESKGHAWFVLDGKTLDLVAAGLGSEPSAPEGTAGGAAAGAVITAVRDQLAGSLGLP
jgi:PQQ-like domain